MELGGVGACFVQWGQLPQVYGVNFKPCACMIFSFFSSSFLCSTVLAAELPLVMTMMGMARVIKRNIMMMMMVMMMVLTLLIMVKVVL